MRKNISHAIMSVFVSVFLGLGFLVIVLSEAHSIHSTLDSTSHTSTYEYAGMSAVVSITATPVFTHYFPIVFNNYTEGRTKHNALGQGGGKRHIT